jgi:hypothetical protein
MALMHFFTLGLYITKLFTTLAKNIKVDESQIGAFQISIKTKREWRRQDFIWLGGEGRGVLIICESQYGEFIYYYNLYSREWETEKYTVRYFRYLHKWRYRSRDFFQFAFEREISQFFARDHRDYIINRTLHGGLKIWFLYSRIKNNILLTRCARS